MLAQRGVVERHSSRNGLANRALEADRARLRKLFNALCKNNAFAGERVVGDYDFAKRNAHSQLRLDSVVDGSVELAVVDLECQRGAHSIRCAFEFGDQCIATQFMRRAAIG